MPRAQEGRNPTDPPARKLAAGASSFHHAGSVSDSKHDQNPLVGVIMGSKSDWESTMKHTHEMLTRLGIPHECQVVSAHRTPELMIEYARGAEARGLELIIAGAGGAAHLPGMTASETLLPVIGVPVQSRALDGMDSLLSIVQMPAGVPVATMAIGKAGAINAALYAAAMLARTRPELRQRLAEHREAQARQVKAEILE